MSGSYLFNRALPYEVHAHNYQQAISALGLANATTQERIQALSELIAKLPPSILTAPAVDGDIILSAPSYAHTANITSNVPKRRDWYTDLMIGNAQMDVSSVSQETQYAN
jgi:hypothetical protein